MGGERGREGERERERERDFFDKFLGIVYIVLGNGWYQY